MLDILLQSCVQSISSFLTSPYTGWFPIVMVSVLLIITVMAFVYTVSGFIGRRDISENIKISIYQSLFALVLIMIFGAFSTWLCTFGVSNQLSNLNLNAPNAPSDANIYKDALYNLYYFTNAILANANNNLFALLIALNYGVKLSISVNVPGIQGLGFGVAPIFSLAGPLSTFSMYASDSLGWLFLINYIQFILISASPIIFAIFISIGLIARIFGISRSFGGSLIALALGIGFVYPLMVSLTYGFINYSFYSLQSNVFQNIIGDNLQSIIISILEGSATFGTSIILKYIMYVVNTFGFVLTASALLPLLNFVVVDTFVLDFSGAFGERMSFMNLLTRIV